MATAVANQLHTLKGLVTKAGCMDKTVTVTVNRLVQDRKTRKMLVRSTKFLTHDANNELQKDDIVLIRQAPPLSKRKTHILHRILRSPESEALAARAGLLSQSQKEHAERERIAREREGQGREDVRIASEVMELARRAVVERDVKRREMGLQVD